MTVSKFIRISLFLLASLVALPVRPAFDPVKQDIDLFMLNPAVNSARPNVLIILDNTANWNQVFSNEKSALVSLINGLDGRFNVGLGLYVETGGGNDNVDGAYIRFAVRQMTGTPQTTLSAMVNALDILGDKGNNNTIGLAMSEAYRYFRGDTSFSSFGKVKTDFAGNASNAAGALSGNALPANPTSASLFSSPVTDNCQNNYVIYIGNGKFNENASARATAESRLQTATGSAPATIAISPSGQQGNWADEWARFMAYTGFPRQGQTSKINVRTYAVAVDPASNYWDTDSLRLMKSMSQDNGKGRYFEVSGNASDIVAALTDIFNEIQAVNSVFASTTLPVSVNVRGTNINQVYVGMFRPDANKDPRWFGNLKMYKVAADSSKNLYLADAAGARAEDPGTGFVGVSNRSFWTHDSTFWGFRTADENGVGGASDSPDGNLVEKGAAAQRLRDAYASSQAARKLYTCTSGTAACLPCASAGSGSSKICSNSYDLSNTPFATGNDGITPLNLGLGSKDVASLSAKVTRTVSALTDRRNVVLNNSTGATVTNVSVSNGAVTGTISGLSTATTRVLENLTAIATTTVSRGISSITKSSSKFVVTTSAAHGFASGATVVISGNSAAAYNGTWTVASPTTNTFEIAVSGNPGTGNGGTVSGLIDGPSTTAKARLTNHGFNNADQVTISGAVPTIFSGTYGVTVIDANNFTFNLSSSAGDATTYGSATASSLTATATTSAAHGLLAGNSVVISGAGIGGYNGTFSVLASPAPTATTFSYAVASKLTPSSNSGITYYKSASGSTTVSATTAVAHGLSSGSYAISGPNSCYTGSNVAITVTGANTFTYSTASVCTTPAAGAYTVSGTATGATVTATLASHNFAAQCPDGMISIFGSDSNHAGNWGAVTVIDANTFTYSTGVAKPVPTGSFTVACTNSPRAFATAAAHGFGTGDTLTIAGVSTAGANGVYNTTTATTSVSDVDHFDYALSSLASGAATTTTSITASKNTTTAVAYSVNHGFSSGTTVSIAGATPSAFNGTFSVTSLGANTFTYTLASPQGDASGTIVAAAASGSGSERDLIINWVRGQDNAEDENKNSSTTDCRASVHGDVLHSRPAVINYNRYGGDNDVYIFYGANDGVFHAIKGGASNDGGDPVSLNPGDEAWGFVPEENFSNLKRLRNNSPVIGSAFKKPYFMDGPIGAYTKDANGDGKLEATDGDQVYLYVGARRGGRFLYSLDATNPLLPKYRWRITNATAGFGELGYTWSQPVVVSGINGYNNPVLIFGGGYDPSVEDVENCTVQSASATSVSYYTGSIKYTSTGCTDDNGNALTASSTPNATVSRSMGRAIYMVDAITGELIWWAGRSGSGASLEVSGLDFALVADPLVVRSENSETANHAYFADTGGNVWRFDFGSADRAAWTVTKIAALASQGTASERRKFLYPPDVVGGTGYDMVLIGSGDREHPFDMTVTNRFYMIKDRGTDLGPVTGTDASHPTITQSLLYDATSAAQISASATATADQKTAASQVAVTGIAGADGWYVTLGAGEKDVGSAVTLNNVVFFNTNVSPMSGQVSSASACANNLGIANQYQLNVQDVSAKIAEHAGGGFLPSPVRIVVQVDVVNPVTGTTSKETLEGVVSGTSISQPEGATLGTRARRFWYKEID